MVETNAEEEEEEEEALTADAKATNTQAEATNAPAEADALLKLQEENKKLKEEIIFKQGQHDPINNDFSSLGKNINLIKECKCD